MGHSSAQHSDAKNCQRRDSETFSEREPKSETNRASHWKQSWGSREFQKWTLQQAQRPSRGEKPLRAEETGQRTSLTETAKPEIQNRQRYPFGLCEVSREELKKAEKSSTHLRSCRHEEWKETGLNGLISSRGFSENAFADFL
jgi:hypothetical protein